MKTENYPQGVSRKAEAEAAAKIAALEAEIARLRGQGKLDDDKVEEILRGPALASAVADGNGLYLEFRRASRVKGERGTGYWFHRYQLGGKPDRVYLGTTDELNVEEARKRNRETRQRISDGWNPKAERESRKTAKPVGQVRTLDQVWFGIPGVDTEPGWRAKKSKGLTPDRIRRWDVYWERYIRPALGNMSVADIKTDTGPDGGPDVLKTIDWVWNNRKHGPDVLGLLERVLDYAKVRNWRTGDNPARWVGHLDAILTRDITPPEHRKGLKGGWAEVPGFMAQLRERTSPPTGPSVRRISIGEARWGPGHGNSARVLELAILTASRVDQIRLARWSWMNWGERVLIVPAQFTKTRKKTGEPDYTPVPPRGMTLLTEQFARRRPDDTENSYIFPGGNGGPTKLPGGNGGPVSPVSPCWVAKAVSGDKDVTAHGFRNLFSDWAHETTEFSPEVIDIARGKEVKTVTQRAYWRSKMPKQRRQLIEQWAEYCESPPTRIVMTGGVPVRMEESLIAAQREENCTQTFMRLLRRFVSEQRHVSPKRRSCDFAPKVFATCPDRDGFTTADFSYAMERLLTAKAIGIDKRVDMWRNEFDCLIPLG
jgi:integrase